jgi:transposase
VDRETRCRCRLNVLWRAAWILRKRWAEPADLNLCILRSRRRTTWWEFSAWLFARRKYDDHLPLYRQAEIFAREGVNLETSTLSGWVGTTAAAVPPLIDALVADIMASDTLHVDDTPVPVLAPGTGKTKTGRLWVYVRDERPFTGARPPAALFFYSPDRKGAHPRTHLKDFRGIIHADGYAGSKELFAGNRIVEAGCWAHVRRKFFDVHAANGSPIAKEALDRIGQLYRASRK